MLPHPVAPLVSALGVITKVIAVVTLAMATCTVLLQVLAETDPVLVVNVVGAIWITAPATDGVAAGRFAAGTSPLDSVRQSLPVVPAVQFAGVYVSAVVTCEEVSVPP